MAYYMSDDEDGLYYDYDDYDDYRHDYHCYGGGFSSPEEYDMGLSSQLALLELAHRLQTHNKDVTSECSSDESDKVEVKDVCLCEDDLDSINSVSDVTRFCFADIEKLQSENNLSDVIIKIESQEFQAHKNILAASSGYFNTMFTSGFQEAGAAEVTVEGESKIFEVLLHYIYTGDMNNLTEENASDVLNMACYLDLAPHALQECKRLTACLFDDKSISMQEAFQISMRPEPELCDIAKAANGYIKHTFTDLAEKPQFLDETSPECLDMFLDNIKDHKSDKQV
ncbi:kelch-like protein 18 [Amphiura filiformis]|uniref:kelch-like protein 18 n=1 Tax=Amphiura filiformis TaxID=82378 RepID=UPI003B21C4D4